MSRVCQVILLGAFLVGLASGCGHKDPQISSTGNAPTLKQMTPSGGTGGPKVSIPQ